MRYLASLVIILLGAVEMNLKSISHNSNNELLIQVIGFNVFIIGWALLAFAKPKS